MRSITLDLENRPDPLAPYYMQWYWNCRESIRWIIEQSNYPTDEIEWLVDYYEQQTTVYWCKAQTVDVVSLLLSFAKESC